MPVDSITTPITFIDQDESAINANLAQQIRDKERQVQIDNYQRGVIAVSMEQVKQLQQTAGVERNTSRQTLTNRINNNRDNSNNRNIAG